MAAVIAGIVPHVVPPHKQASIWLYAAHTLARDVLEDWMPEDYDIAL